MRTVKWSLNNHSLKTAIEITKEIPDYNPFITDVFCRTMYFENQKVRALNEIIHYCNKIGFENLDMEDFFEIAKLHNVESTIAEDFIKKYVANLSEKNEYEKFLNCLSMLDGQSIFDFSIIFGEELVKKNEWEYLIKFSKEIICEDLQENKSLTSYFEDLSEDSCDSTDIQTSHIKGGIIKGLRACIAKHYFDNENYYELIRICQNNKNIYEKSHHLELYAINLFKDGAEKQAEVLIKNMNRKSKNICLSKIIFITLDNNINMEQKKSEKSALIDKCIDYCQEIRYPDYELKKEAINHIGKICLDHKLYESFCKHTYKLPFYILRDVDSEIQNSLFVSMMRDTTLNRDREEIAYQHRSSFIGFYEKALIERVISIVTSLLDIGLLNEAKIILQAIDNLTVNQETIVLKEELLNKIEKCSLKEKMLAEINKSSSIKRQNSVIFISNVRR